MRIAKTGIISDIRMLDHRSKPRHPESPARVKAILKMLQEKGLLEHPRVDYVSKYDRAATDDDIRLVYADQYVNYLKKLWPEGEERVSIPLGDSYCSKDTELAARISAGGVLQGIDKVMSGEWSNGFCIVRPPGHHSGAKDKINGFCVLNNVAMGARYLQLKHDLQRIAILDYDVHQGDGTHHIFDGQQNVLFISVHRYDRGAYYPGGPSGNYVNCGYGLAEGTKLNIPLNTVNKKKKSYDYQTPGDNEYVYLYDRIIHPILKEFDPQFILVSSGFDASRKDYLGGFTVTPNGYFFMTRRLVELGKPLLCVLEGGYHLGSTAQAATAVVKGLLQEEDLPEPKKEVTYQNINLKCHLQNGYHDDLDEIIQHHSKYWKCLQSEESIQYTKQIKTNSEKQFGLFEQESSSSSSEEEQDTKTQEQTREQEEFQTSKTSYNKHDFDQATAAVFKDFSYTNTKVLKLINPGQAKFYEANFPQKIFAPKYFGQKGSYLIIENILCKKKGGQMIEIKLSKQSKNPGLAPQAIEKETKKESKSTSQKLCFRIAAITTPQDKQSCLLIDDQGTVKKILKKVVDTNNRIIFTSFLNNLASELKKAKRLYFGSSILLIKGKEDSSIYWTNIYDWYPHEEQYDSDTIQGLLNLAKFIELVD